MTSTRFTFHQNPLIFYNYRSAASVYATPTGTTGLIQRKSHAISPSILGQQREVYKLHDSRLLQRTIRPQHLTRAMPANGSRRSPVKRTCWRALLKVQPLPTALPAPGKRAACDGICWLAQEAEGLKPRGGPFRFSTRCQRLEVCSNTRIVQPRRMHQRRA